MISGNFPCYPETFQTIQKITRLSGNFPDYPKTFQTMRKLYRPYGKYPDYLEIFQTVRKLPSAISGVTRKNFPDAQKLSGWQCHHATQVFKPLQVDPLLNNPFFLEHIILIYDSKSSSKLQTCLGNLAFLFPLSVIHIMIQRRCECDPVPPYVWQA